jgi:hypothetical protein
MGDVHKLRALLAGTESTNGTYLNNASEYNLSFAESVCTGGYFYTPSDELDRIYIRRAGDYLISVLMPLTADGGARTSLDSKIYVNGVLHPAGYFNSSYIRYDDGHGESSNHMNLFLNNLQVGDYITISVANGSSTADTIFIDESIDRQYTVLLKYISEETKSFGAYTVETTNGTDFNTATAYPLKWIDKRCDNYYTHDNTSSPQNITLTTSGVYLGFVNLPLYGTSERTNITGNVVLDGTTISGGIFQQGYIRADSSHNSSSIHWSGPIYYDGTTSGVLQITTEQEAAAGTVTTGGSTTSGSIYLEYLDTDELFIGYGDTLEGGLTDWHVGDNTPVEWKEVTFKDSDVFSHDIVSDSCGINILQDGDYLVVLNVPVELTAGIRTNLRVFVQLGHIVSTFESNHYSSYDSSGAFDGIYGDCSRAETWWSNAENEAWVGCELSTPRIVTQVTIHPTWEYEVRCPTEIEVRAANSEPSDGITEGTVLCHETGISWSDDDPGQTFEFSNSTAYTHYWVTCLDKVDSFGRGAEYHIAEVIFADSLRSYGAAGGSDGAMTKCFYARGDSGHDHSSGCITYLLENAVAGSQLTIEVNDESTSGNFEVKNKAVLLIKKRNEDVCFYNVSPNNNTYYKKTYNMRVTASGIGDSSNYDAYFYSPEDDSLLGTAVSGVVNNTRATVSGVEFTDVGSIEWYVKSIFTTISGFSDIYSFTRASMPFDFSELPVEGAVYDIGLDEIPQLSTTISAGLSDCSFNSYILLDSTDEVLIGPVTLSGVGTISGTWDGYFQGRKYDIYTKAIPLGKYEGDEVVSSGTYFRTSGWQTGYRYRRKITIDGSKIVGSHADFPLVFNLTGDEAEHLYNNTNQFYDTMDEYRIAMNADPVFEWDFGGTTGTGSILGWTYRQIEAPPFPGIAYSQDYVTFEGDCLENALGEEYEDNESEIQVYLRFRPHNVFLGEYQTIWQSGSYTNGIAVGITPNGYLGVRVGSYGDGEVTISGALVDNKWYEAYVYNDHAILIDEDGGIRREGGEITPTDGDINPSVGGAYDVKVMTQDNGTGYPFYGDLDKVVTYDNTSCTTYRDTALSINVGESKRKYLDFVLIDDETKQPLDVFFETLSPGSGTSSCDKITFWTKVPTLSGGPDKVLYMYYGGDGSSDYTYDYSDSTSVWDSDTYRAIYLMEAPSFNTNLGGLLDCTSNGINMDSSSTQEGNSRTLTSGVVGYGVDFDHGMYVYSSTHMFESDPTTFNLFCVFKTSVGDQDSVIWKEGGSGEGVGIGFKNGKFRAVGLDGGLDVIETTSSGYADDTHHFFCVEFDKDTDDVIIYRNNYVLDGSVNGYVGLGGTNPSIGAAYSSNPVHADAENHWYEGQLSLLWFMESTVTSGFVTTHYNNIMDNSNFFTLGEVKTPFYNDSYNYGFDISIATTTDGFLDSYDVYFFNPESGLMATSYNATDGSVSSSQHDEVASSDTLYYWYPAISGSHYYLEDPDVYSFTRTYLCSGYTDVDGTRVSGIPVRLYKRDTGEFIGSTTSAGVSGTFSLGTEYNVNHYAIALHPTNSGLNAVVYDWIKPEA